MGFKLGSYRSNMDVMECFSCKNRSTLAEWDRHTFATATCREDRRTYVSLTRKNAYNKDEDVWYCCPKCNLGQQGYEANALGLVVSSKGTDNSNSW